jgi:hypothetical protein
VLSTYGVFFPQLCQKLRELLWQENLAGSNFVVDLQGAGFAAVLVPQFLADLSYCISSR